MTFNEREFRNALGFFATGVAVITAEVDGNRLGATVSSFNSVSLTPPLVVFSLARARSLSQWRSAKAFGISILGEGQDELSNHFARSGADKWDGIKDHRAANGAPMLPNWLARFECEPYARHDGGDHEIFVSRVTAFEVRASPIRPLLFYTGKYHGLNLQDAISTPPEADIWLHGW